MARKFTGVRNLGSLPPETRSVMMNMARAIKGLSAARRAEPRVGESNIARGFSAKNLYGPSAGGRPTVVTFGLDADKPTTQRLLERGTGAFVYVAQDTDTVYMWNGREYKSSVFT